MKQDPIWAAYFQGKAAGYNEGLEAGKAFATFKQFTGTMILGFCVGSVAAVVIYYVL